MIGERLAEIRKDHGDKQTDLAEKLNVTVSTVRSWEQEKSSPPHEMLVRICRLYRVSSDYLLGLSDVDPAYVQRQRLENLSKQELKVLNDFEDFLIWRKNRNAKSE
ncbi:MAG: helix-turn-helix domain-containing protein [Lachnospiraceae bacterium]|nr:helix-turn-helix domain-containing protein [Lachnospiraceae bacterium]